MTPRLFTSAVPDAAEVIPGLLVGSAPSSRVARTLANAGVTQVVDLRVDRPFVDWPDEVYVSHHPLVEFEAPEVAELDEISSRVADLVSSGHTVYLHCREGIQRAPMVACATLMQMGWPLADAVRQVTTRRSTAALTEEQLGVLQLLSRGLQSAQAGVAAAG